MDNCNFHYRGIEICDEDIIVLKIKFSPGSNYRVTGKLQGS